MADTEQIDPTKAGNLAQKIVLLLKSESSETRRRVIQAAMTLLGEQSVEEPLSNSSAVKKDLHGAQNSDPQALFHDAEKLKPSENAYLCAAHHFSLYGNASFSLDELRAIAGEAGVVLPDRLDMTLKQAGKSGKKLFQPVGRDAYRPTAAAGLFFKERWAVKPGNKNKPAAAGKP
jgi:hypothetical protein